MLFTLSKNITTDHHVMFHITTQWIKQDRVLVVKMHPNIGSVEAIVSQDLLNDPSMQIVSVKTNQPYRGLGVASTLLKRLIGFAWSCYPCIQRVELDDMSDRAWQKAQNLYCKLGFRYVNPQPEPEMVLDISCI